jgi:molybdate transport system substrate-binding protein
MLLRRRPRLLLTVVTALCLLGAAACGDDGDGAAATSAAAEPSATTGAGASGEVTVFAAASLTEAFRQLGEDFMAENPDAEVTFNFAASSALVQQITEGAPADVFASADQANMAKLTDAALNGSEPRVFAENQLRIIVPAGNPEGIEGLADLADPGLVYVTAAPEVPIGRYAAESLAKAGVTVTPASLEENVKAVVTKVTLGEADAGIVYATDVTAAGSQAEGVDIPAEHNVLATYPIATTGEAPNPEGAEAFVDHVLSPEGQAVLRSFGFSVS